VGHCERFNVTNCVGAGGCMACGVVAGVVGWWDRRVVAWQVAPEDGGRLACWAAWWWADPCAPVRGVGVLLW